MPQKRVAVEHVEQVLARVVVGGKAGARAIAHVDMIIDQRRHHGLAGEIDPHSARRRRDLAAPADRRDPVVGDDEGGVLDRRAPSPVMRRAPSNTVAPPVPALGDMPAQRRQRARTTRATPVDDCGADFQSSRPRRGPPFESAVAVSLCSARDPTDGVAGTLPDG